MRTMQQRPSAGRSDFKDKSMTTKLEKPLKRQIEIKGKPFIVTITPTGLKLTEKGKRKGQELVWADLASGQTALAVALNASLEHPTTK
jgi:hypothetical protein